MHCNLSKTRNTGRDLAARNGVQSNRACQIIEHGRGYVVYVCAIHSFKRGENGMSIGVRVQLEGAWCTVSRSMIGKYITRANGAKKKMAGNEKTGPEHDGRIIHKHTHTHPIPFLHPISICSFFAYPKPITQTHRCTHTHTHTLTLTHALTGTTTKTPTRP